MKRKFNLFLIVDPGRYLEHMNGQGIIHCLQKYGYVLTFFQFIQVFNYCLIVFFLFSISRQVK